MALETKMTFTNGVTYEIGMVESQLVIRLYGGPLEPVLQAVSLPMLQFNTDNADLQKLVRISQLASQLYTVQNQGL